MSEEMKQDGLPDEGAEDHTEQAPTPPGAEGAPLPEATDTPDGVSGSGGEEPTAEPTPDWSFGEGDSTDNRRGMRVFIGMFSAVVVLCLLLLGVTFFLGDGGIRIVRTLNNERTVFVREYTGEGGLLTTQEVADSLKKSTVSVIVRTDEGGLATGSGFVWSADGYICTNHHVIQQADAVQVVLYDNRVFDATVIGSTASSDIAVLKINADGLTPAVLGRSADLLAGDVLVAVGTPARLELAGTVTTGTVSHPSRLLTRTNTAGEIYCKQTLIQTDAELNNGNSGGPVANLYGEVVGMVMMKFTNYANYSFEGISFLLPIDGVRIIVEEIIDTGSFDDRDDPITEPPSMIGINGYAVQKGRWYYPDPDSNKILISETEKTGYHLAEVTGFHITRGSANAAGKVQNGDVLVAINGLTVMTSSDVFYESNRHYIGETVTLTLWRDGTLVYVDVMISEKS